MSRIVEQEKKILLRIYFMFDHSIPLSSKNISLISEKQESMFRNQILKT